MIAHGEPCGLNVLDPIAGERSSWWRVPDPGEAHAGRSAGTDPAPFIIVFS